MSIRPHYKSNPNPGYRCRYGIQLRDSLTGKWTYMSLTTIDDAGNRVIYTRDFYDQRPDLNFNPTGNLNFGPQG